VVERTSVMLGQRTVPTLQCCRYEPSCGIAQLIKSKSMTVLSFHFCLARTMILFLMTFGTVHPIRLFVTVFSWPHRSRTRAQLFGFN